MRKFILFMLALFFITPSGMAEYPDETGGHDKVILPILMYHRVIQDPGSQGRYSISPQALEADLVYLKENGYESVFMSEVIAFVNGTGGLPVKPVVLSFDDGNSSDYKYLYPLLKQYNMKAVLSIIGKETDKFSSDGRDITFPNIIWSQVAEMVESGHAEIQSHGYDLHGANGALKLKGESLEEYEKRLSRDLFKFQERVKEITGTVPSIFTYPKGMISKGSGEILKNLGFSGTFGCEEGLNFIEVGKPEKLFLMKRMIRTPRVSAEKALSNALKALKKD